MCESKFELKCGRCTCCSYDCSEKQGAIDQYEVMRSPNPERKSTKKRVSHAENDCDDKIVPSEKDENEENTGFSFQD